ncbi:SIS domain-containing protein [Novosphingobium sp. KA1]|uniref:SIS domain-containing protein n=1 Tax=Novosphingobium sp. (strain KA1) TaxID=164608 RepID=UPI001A8FD222|nr:SIS domain-containing protein [Novosphingobium sp. KA1]QSR19130.1 iron dicitrate transport regulator FecR [Novosphingobium sp. KA1]
MTLTKPDLTAPETHLEATEGETLMAREAREAPLRCSEQLQRNAELVREAGRRLRALAPPFAATLARGSSDQAAAFAKFLLETHAGVPTLSHAPSVGSLYHATSPRFAGVPLIAISQSGRSPDLLAAAEDAKAQGAVVIAVVNDAQSPLADLAEIVIPVHAGPETSVAATKSFVCTLVALTHLVAEWSEDAALLAALETAGEVLEAAAAADWTQAVELLKDAGDMLVLGRGPTLPIAGEAALKLKETSSLHAEAFSSAEVAHGPMTLVGAGDPVLVLAPLDVARTGLRERLDDFAARGARVIAAGMAEDIAPAALTLPSRSDVHPVLGAIAAIQSFYGLANALSLARGRNPDNPPHLNKVTRTL